MVIQRASRGGTSTNDGSCLVAFGTTGRQALICSVEAKPEIGKGKCCAFMEGVCYHAIWAAEEGSKLVLRKTSCPSFLCLLTGPFFQVFGTVFTNNLYCDPLAPAHPLFILPYDRSTMETISRCFAALKMCIISLQNYYAAAPEEEQPRFPYLRSFQGFKWTWLRPLHEFKQVWLAELPSSQKVVVKFSDLMQKPALDALQVCSKHTIAPALITGGTWNRWVVTVSQYVDGETIDQLLRQTSNKDHRATLVDKAILKAKEMHKLNVVHGDLRAPNILVEKKTEFIYFVDFDFAGVTGNTHYPLYLNSDIAWPDGVEAGKPIMPDHDIYWLLKLKTEAV